MSSINQRKMSIYILAQLVIWPVSGIIIIIGGWCFIRGDIRKFTSHQPIEAVKEENGQLLSLRLQAHERMIVFVDRLNPSNLFLRLYQQGISAYELQTLILHEIRSEYQHNVSQQLYVNSTSWNVLRKLKEDTIAMVNNAVGGLPAEASGKDLSRKVLEHMAGITENPYDLTLELIKKDIHQLF